MDLEANWVAGRWKPAAGEATVIVSPIDGEPLHTVRFAGDREIEMALAAAAKAEAAMAATSQAQRARALSDLAAGLKNRAEEIAEATILANGCPRKQALAMQALSAVALFEAFAPLAKTHALRASCLVRTPKRRTPAGTKGMAEGSVMGAIGAVKIAVNDALTPFKCAYSDNRWRRKRSANCCVEQPACV
jgi:acyl-CoA reductase-like NAD-dependent aldehyde dehydrogenase